MPHKLDQLPKTTIKVNSDRGMQIEYSLEYNLKYQKLTVQCQHQAQQQQMQKHTTLYVKQFFHNFLAKQQHTNTLNLLGSSLEVLDELINKFTSKHSIVTPSYGPMQGRNHQEQGFQTIVSALYGKLSAAFEWVDNNINTNEKNTDRMNQSINDTSSITSRSFNFCQPNDDEELYQILNQYKSNNKKLKQNVAVLTQKLESKNREFKQLKIMKQIGDKQIEYANSRVEELEDELKDLEATLNAQQDQLHGKNTIISQLQAKIEQANSQLKANADLIKNYKDQINSYEQKCKKLGEENQGLRHGIDMADKQNKERLNRKLQQIPALIDSKLNSGKVQMAGIQVLMKFMKHNQSVKNSIKSEKFFDFSK